tara:strand:- start:662 stop:1681 length:1020 start_codon:yes stop_codon:yes gene_type:complete
MRCLSLADGLKGEGWSSAFAGGPDTGATLKSLGADCYDFVALPGDGGDDVTTLAMTWPQGVDFLVVDNYELDATFESACRPWARNVMAIDDLADRSHDVDLLLDQTVDRSEADYRKVVGPDCRLLLGTRYALLRDQFRNARERSLVRRPNATLDKILVSYGSLDLRNCIPTTLEGITLSGIRAEINIVIGPSAPRLGELEEFIRNKGISAVLHVGVHDMARLIEEADLAIGAAGTTAWEFCCLGLPAFLVTTSPNQITIGKSLEARGAAHLMGHFEELSPERFAEHLEKVVENADLLHEMSIAAAKVCDGLGVSRVVDAMLSCGTNSQGVRSQAGKALA